MGDKSREDTQCSPKVHSEETQETIALEIQGLANRLTNVNLASVIQKMIIDARAGNR